MTFDSVSMLPCMSYFPFVIKKTTCFWAWAYYSCVQKVFISMGYFLCVALEKWQVYMVNFFNGSSNHTDPRLQRSNWSHDQDVKIPRSNLVSRQRSFISSSVRLCNFLQKAALPTESDWASNGRLTRLSMVVPIHVYSSFCCSIPCLVKGLFPDFSIIFQCHK